ncbi:putative mitochondrial import inner membrane translocase subunit tim-21 precursor [Triangularia verruculosa]|uniref:Mitochondrial import inner membrane translocase subunit Tim21 n=1 Tax=Triangularia verruculosa TaxID=2587418 RepID=A0AAN6XEZ9_9PEZI|nr:putative mitochondrial import inner membrane translocase subunit tim-21 precursor [Triangularia verruculosa]
MIKPQLIPAIRLRTLTSTSPVVTVPLLSPRRYATHHQPSSSKSESEPKRRSVTPFNDTGSVPWSSLSVLEKGARASQQTFNFGLVILGLTLTSGVLYVLYTEVFSPSSRTAYFNRAVDRIKTDARLIELLGDGKKIEAFGEETGNKWRRARPIASSEVTDRNGVEHMYISFNLKGPRGTGKAYVHLFKPVGGRQYEYKYFYVDVKGHQRIYLENAEAAAALAAKERSKTEGFKFLGIRW